MSQTNRPRRLGFPKTSRVVRGGDFTLALRRGGVAANDCLVVFALPREDGSRLGVTIPKKTGNAVVRNRWKRLIREAYRLHQHELPEGFDLIFRPKKDATPSWQSIESGFVKLVSRAVRRSKPSNA